MTWLLGFLAYAAVVVLMLLLVGGVRRADTLHARAARNARKPLREPKPAPLAPRPAEGSAMRVARSLIGR
jgi:hypothetical protein